ncbi:phosphoribosylformylglycinamidine synthase [Sediminicola sp. YIK13]|uniref:DUF4287 domain-containing protein n=1 Tax=Sediminicola sp. YIK13 TaxID=1453352 RepID=UPI0007230D12|nr:DUF4287 domain-containing protein [Sediminicola sp. YIK13]ALM07826.1 phosphoribosylformylglycinamidine synthase [Sediminicola sp. YIK13]
MDQALKTMINNMPEKTGKSLQEWKKILKAKAFNKHSEAMNFLKKEHGVTHGFANTIVHLSKDNIDAPEDLVAIQYQGKEQLLPIYNMLIATVDQFGPDVVITPKKGAVSLIRKKQFALIKPATKTRVDLGLKLMGKEETARLGNSGPFGTMCTHRVQITSVDQVDQQLKNWLKEAYEKAT